MNNFLNPSSFSVSQTEALLEAIHIGFFEAYLASTTIKKAISGLGEKIRIDVNVSNAGNAVLKLKTCQNEWVTSCQKDCLRSGKRQSPNYSVAFHQSDLNLLLSHPDCSGVRFYPGTITMADGKAQPTLIAVGVRSNGFDIDDEPGYLRGATFTSTYVI